MSYPNRRHRMKPATKSAQQHNIDKQIWCLHKAMAEKLLSNHQYLPQVLETITYRYDSGKMGHGCYLFWSSLLEHIHQPALFMATVLDNAPHIQKYRRQTPFVGILTEQERQAALEKLIF